MRDANLAAHQNPRRGQRNVLAGTYTYIHIYFYAGVLYDFFFPFRTNIPRVLQQRSEYKRSALGLYTSAAFTVCCSRRSSWLANRYTTSARHVVSCLPSSPPRLGRESSILSRVSLGVCMYESICARRRRPIPLFPTRYVISAI